jgi:putative Holliday junction resolvase
LTDNVTAKGRILGLDIGEKRIGVALSDPEGILAVPVSAIGRKSLESDMEAVQALVLQNDAVRIVAGLPLSLDGSLGHQARRVQDFLHQLSLYVDIPVDTWDERFSTAAAARMMTEAGVKEEKRKERVDAMAAAFILQGYLDRRRNLDDDQL